MSVLTRFYVKKKKTNLLVSASVTKAQRLVCQVREMKNIGFFFPKLKLLFLNNRTNSQVTEDRGAELIGVHCRLQLLIILVV